MSSRDEHPAIGQSADKVGLGFKLTRRGNCSVGQVQRLVGTASDTVSQSRVTFVAAATDLH